MHYHSRTKIVLLYGTILKTGLFYFILNKVKGETFNSGNITSDLVYMLSYPTFTVFLLFEEFLF